MTRFSLTLLGLSLISFAGCGDDSDALDAGLLDAGSDVQTTDAGPGEADAGPGEADAGPGEADAGPPEDAGPPPLPEPMNHRPEHGAMCDNLRASPEIMPDLPGCASHGECSDGDNGRCLAGRAGYSCSYDLCFSDDDCTGPCLCGETDTAPNSCTGGGCQIDSDCGAGGWCSPTLGGCGDLGGVVAFECHTPEDECTDDVDCEGENAYCAYSEEAGHWACSTAQCAG